MNLKGWLGKLLFLSLLMGTLSCLIFPIYYQKKLDAANPTVLADYKKAVKQGKTDSTSEYQKKYNDYLLKQGVIHDASLPEFSSIQSHTGVIGAIELPTVRISEAPIYKEETKESFFHYKYGSFPTVGTSGHLVIKLSDCWRYQVNLLKITQLRVGDCFYLKMGNRRQAYEITTIEQQGKQANTKIVPGEQLVTIEMKNLSGFTDNQLTIISKKVPIKSVQKVHTTPKIIFTYPTFVLLFLLLNLIFFTVLVMLYQRYVRKAHSKPFRTKHGGYKNLRRLLQITRGYYILLVLIMSFYLLVMIYRYHSLK